MVWWTGGALGATKTFSGINKYHGLWDVDDEPNARFELNDNNLRFEIKWVIDDSEEGISEVYQSFRWKGSFVSTTTGEIIDWWNYDFTFTFDDEVMTGTAEGAC